MAFLVPPFFRPRRKRADPPTLRVRSYVGFVEGLAAISGLRLRLRLVAVSGLGLAAVSGVAARDIPAWHALLTETELLTPKDWERHPAHKPRRPVPALTAPVTVNTQQPVQPPLAEARPAQPVEQPPTLSKTSDELLTPRTWRLKRPQLAALTTDSELLIPADWSSRPSQQRR